MVDEDSVAQSFPWGAVPRPSEAAAASLDARKALRRLEKSPASYLALIWGIAGCLQSDAGYRTTEAFAVAELLRFPPDSWECLITLMTGTLLEEWQAASGSQTAIHESTLTAEEARQVLDYGFQVERTRFLSQAEAVLALLETEGELSWKDAETAGAFLLNYLPTLTLATSGQGSTLGSLLTLVDPDPSVRQSKTAELAADRLATFTFPWGKLRYRDDHILTDAVEGFINGERDGGRGRQKAWLDLVGTSIVLAASEITGDVAVGDLYSKMRGAIKGGLRDALIGHRRTRAVDRYVPLTDDVLPAKDLLEFAGERADLLQALATLRPEDKDLLLEYGESTATERRALAQAKGLTDAALRQEISRIRKKLRKAVT